MTEAAHEGTERASSAALVGVEGVTHSSLKSGVSDAGIKIEDLPLSEYTRQFSPGSSSQLGAVGWLESQRSTAQGGFVGQASFGLGLVKTPVDDRSLRRRWTLWEGAWEEV